MPRSGVPREAHILVVDDSPTIRAVLGKMLAQDGHVVFKAGDGESAIELARRELPDLIFLDIVMPGMNGFAVLRALRREALTHDIPIVMISGNLQATEQFYVQRFGADDFVEEAVRPWRGVCPPAAPDPIRASGGATRASAPALPAEPVLSADEQAAIPDIAMPDPQTGTTARRNLLSRAVDKRSELRLDVWLWAARFFKTPAASPARRSRRDGWR
ncbi:response regulator [Rhodanobacter lindaniclasticus]